MNIRINQINLDRDDERVAFCGYEQYTRFTGREEIKSDIYDRVFSGEVNCRDLEDVYCKFNNDFPEGYKGRSLSVSDVVEVFDSETVEPGAYYCDSVGFKRVDFDPEEVREAKDKTMTVVLCEPGKLARIAEIGTSLEDKQGVVGGTIQAIYPYDEPVCLVCDDNGKVNSKPLNRAVYGEDGEMVDIIAGTFFVCDCSGENFAGLSKEQQERFLDEFRYPERFVRVNGNIAAIKYEPDAPER